MNPLTAYERWMVGSNLARIAAEGNAENIIATLRANGYDRVANAVGSEVKRERALWARDARP